MTRVTVFAAGLAVAFAMTARADGWASATRTQPRRDRADLPVAPPPRPAGQPAGPDEDPAVVLDRIIANSKSVTEKLARTETGEPTQATQATILKDIDALLNRQDPAQSSSGGGGGGGGGGQSSGGMGKSGGQPMGGQGGGGGGSPGGQQAKGRKPRGSGKKDGQQPGGQEMANAGGKKDDQPGGAKAGGQDPKGGKGTTAGAAGGPDPGKPVPRPTVPLDDEVAKEVWGHLPDKVRQQVTQYYKEEFMPRYAELLKQYYSSLATTPGKGGEMRK